MKVIDAGHLYELQMYSPVGEASKPFTKDYITYFKKIGENFPGNAGKAYSGVNCQEVLRVLIDRCKYLNNQKPCSETMEIISLLREALYQFEFRAARVKGALLPPIINIEDVLPCDKCGHIYTHSHE